MVKRTQKDRALVLALKSQGWSDSAIKTRYGFSQCFVDRWRHADTVEDAPRSGRKRKLSETQEAQVVQLSRGKRGRSVRKTARLARRLICDVGKNTVWRTLKKHHLKPYHRRKVPRLTMPQQQKRLRFARRNNSKDWSHTVFSDEKKWILFDDPNTHNDVVWCASPEEAPPVETEKWKVVTSCWGAICSRGVLALHFYSETLDAQKYQQILADNLLQQANALYEDRDWEFQQDSARAHSARSTQTWLRANAPSFISPDEWPANSPDLNPTENIWGIVAERVAMRHPTTLRGFQRVIREEWSKVELETIQRTINSLPRRLHEVISRRGQATTSH